ncbi:MAG: hypothetical protein ACHRXM_28935 [Isosphaerales bacterium]
MKATHQPDTEELLDRAGTGDRSARQQLLARHRARLRQMVALRIFDLPDESEAALAERLVSSGSSPSAQQLRAELREPVQLALEALEPRDRWVLERLRNRAEISARMRRRTDWQSVDAGRTDCQSVLRDFER